MTAAILLIATLAIATAGAAGQTASGTSAFVPDSTFELPGMPQVVRLHMPGSQIVALRLSVRMTEPPSEAGAARILQRLGVCSADDSEVSLEEHRPQIESIRNALTK